MAATLPFHNMWSVDAVRLGFEFEFLMNAIFAISALHLARGAVSIARLPNGHDEDSIFKGALNGQTPFDLGVDPVGAHHFYLNLAYKQQREAAANISPQNINALYLSSVLLGYQNLRVLDRDEDFALGRYEPPTSWLRMMNAVRDITRAAFDIVKPGLSVAHLIADMNDPDFRDKAAIFNPENAAAFAELLDWTSHPEAGLDEQSRHAYEQTLYYAGGVHRAIREREPMHVICRRLLVFGILVPSRFTELVDELRPRALAILAIYCALYKAVDDHWLFHGISTREVDGLWSLIPSDWQWAMQWAQALLQVDYSVA